MSRQRLLFASLALLAGAAPLVGSAQDHVPDRAAQDQGFATAQLSEPTRRPPADVGAMKTSFSPVVKRAAPAVVNVYARRTVRQRVDPFWDMFGGGVPRERVEQSLGSGVIVRPDGVIVTNNHVVEGGQEFMVVLHDRREFPAKVLLADSRSDLAVLKIDTGAERLPILAIDDREDLQVGDLVLAIGNPFGVGQTVTNGIVSALNRTDVGITDYSFFIQTDAAVNPGNSGGALVDMDGDLVGVNTAIFSRSGTSSGVSFAIPSAMVRRVVESAVGGGQTVVRPWLGVKSEPVTAEIARSLALPRPEGVLVADVYPNGPGARAGLRQGDVVLSVDGGAVNDTAGLNFRVATRRPGDTVTLAVLREGRQQTLKARVEPPPASPAKEERTLDGQNPMNGAVVANLSPASADELGLDPFAGPGVVVTRISGRSYAGSAGFRPGDIVREVNGRRIQSTRDLLAALGEPARGWAVTIERDGRLITGQFRG
ncbi:DegQ family serine endoprotease [Caulobacter sp. 17J80-11]|uniref:DegQ family serine endoprotease n=1 Tax=Caulobacter sp. 17J80-11 TaxID=2763502 RepID=UPI0016535EAB|nr:DegQ family serine endoprotease [Caulobacter sp. 17J80-11]MBC6980649.1 DegQ family serine endoprotease [Caulobacter sp. 17J80-11]